MSMTAEEVQKVISDHSKAAYVLQVIHHPVSDFDVFQVERGSTSWDPQPKVFYYVWVNGEEQIEFTLDLDLAILVGLCAKYTGTTGPVKWIVRMLGIDHQIHERNLA